jgi:hypothetical protein
MIWQGFVINTHRSHASQASPAHRAPQFRSRCPALELFAGRRGIERHAWRGEPRHQDPRGTIGGAALRARDPLGPPDGGGRALRSRGARSARSPGRRHRDRHRSSFERHAECQHLRWLRRPVAGAAALSLPSAPNRDIDVRVSTTGRPDDLPRRRHRHRNPLWRRRPILGLTSEFLTGEEVFPVCSPKASGRAHDPLRSAGATFEASHPHPRLDIPIGWATWLSQRRIVTDVDPKQRPHLRLRHLRRSSPPSRAKASSMGRTHAGRSRPRQRAGWCSPFRQALTGRGAVFHVVYPPRRNSPTQGQGIPGLAARRNGRLARLSQLTRFGPAARAAGKAADRPSRRRPRTRRRDCAPSRPAAARGRGDWSAGAGAVRRPDS